MQDGKHQVADKAIRKFGIREVNPHTAENLVKRQRWIALCMDCHDSALAEAALDELDAERARAWEELYAAEDVLKDLRGDDLLMPPPGRRPLYPVDLWEHVLPTARIGFYEGQASAFYNVSRIERDYFEMWYFDNLAAYKATAHGARALADEAHRRLKFDLEAIRREARELRKLSEAEAARGQPHKPGALWLHGRYTDHNREHN